MNNHRFRGGEPPPSEVLKSKSMYVCYSRWYNITINNEKKHLFYIIYISYIYYIYSYLYMNITGFIDQYIKGSKFTRSELEVYCSIRLIEVEKR